MRLYKYCILLITTLLWVSLAYSQEKCIYAKGNSYTDTFVAADTLDNHIRIKKRNTDIEVHFRFDNYNLDLEYMDNDLSLHNLAQKIDSIGISNIDSVVVVSQSSPEGVYEHNIMLSKRRANTMRKYLQENHPELSDRLYVHPDGESWDKLREYVKNDTLMKNSTIEAVLAVLDADVNVGTKKWRLQQLPIYRYLIRTYYPRIRNSTFFILYYNEIELLSEPAPIVPEPIVEEKIEEVAPETIVVEEPVVPVEDEWRRKMYLKTNVLGLGLGMANIATEIDLAEHWSVAVPFYYSHWNYFKSTIKLRILALQPEIRYWISNENNGFFTGAHFGLAYYNFAFDGKYRYQDHNQKTPALGGGLSLGYRLPGNNDSRWKVEFVLGAGAYQLYYDKFHNTPNTKDGLMIESIKRTYWGIDQAAISLSYMFDLMKKGGEQ